jgi:hypothetical protein
MREKWGNLFIYLFIYGSTHNQVVQNSAQQTYEKGK